jgi:cytochrome c-type biogenesis protein CcmH
MTIFWIIAVLLTTGALLFVLPPLLQRGVRTAQGAAPLALTIYRDQHAELEADRRMGVLSDAQYAAARSELERRLLEDIDARDASTPAAPAATSASRLPAVLVALMAPALAVGLYFVIGEPKALAPGNVAPVAGNTHEVTPDQIRAMVERLALRLSQNPDDAEGWAMLARSYNVLGRYQDASAAYGKAVESIPNNASLLADYADALAMARGRKLQGEPEALIQRALVADPNHIKSLALAGSVAFEKRDYAGALTYWERIQRLVPPDSDIARSIGGSIKEARGLAGTPDIAPVATAARPVQAGTSGVSGIVQLAPDLAAKVAPDDTVFIFARAVDGPRMPLAILRKKASELPIQFTLDDSLAMTPQARLSGVPQIIVGARVSKTASASPQAGDLQGMTAPIKNIARDVKVVIDKVIY